MTGFKCVIVQRGEGKMGWQVVAANGPAASSLQGYYDKAEMLADMQATVIAIAHYLELAEPVQQTAGHD